MPDHHDLTWSEIITCGRKMCGEEFVFKKFQNLTNIYLLNKLVIKENVIMEPLKKSVDAIGQMEGYTHQSTLLFVNDRADIKSIVSKCRNLLSGLDIIFGISILPVNGLIFRAMAQKGEILFDCNNRLALYLKKLSDFSINKVHQ